MKEKPQIQYIGREIFTEKEVKVLQQLQEVTKYFEQKIIDNDGNKNNDIGRVFPTRIDFDFEQERVTLLMSNYAKGETVSYGDYITVRRTSDGYLVGDRKTKETDMRQVIDERLEEISK